MDRLRLFLSDNRRMGIRIFIDVLCILIISIPVLVLYCVGKPYRRGFYCDDESIRYPYRPSTISSGLNYFYSTTIAGLTIFAVESIWYFRIHRNSVTNLMDFTWQLYCKLIPLAFGAFVSQLTTDISKYAIGRLRPHFIDVCNPLVNGKWARDLVDCGALKYTYIEDYQCHPDKFGDYALKDARLSFMSGHSSFCAFFMVYTVIYLQKRLTFHSIGFLRPLLQATCLYIAFYTGLSRISDYKHHWSDVLIGLMQGALVAILISRCVSDLFTKTKNQKLEIEQSNTAFRRTYEAIPSTCSSDDNV